MWRSRPLVAGQPDSRGQSSVIAREFDAILTGMARHHRLLECEQAPKCDPVWPHGINALWFRSASEPVADPPRGLRARPAPTPRCGTQAHGLSVAAASAGIALNLVQKWLGHAQPLTTASYAEVVGAEEPSIPARVWRSCPWL